MVAVVAWLTCMVVFSLGSYLESFSLTGAVPPGQLHRAGVFELLLATTSLGLGLLAVLAAALSSRPVWAVGLLLAVAVLAWPAAYVARAGTHDLRAGHQPGPGPTITQCIPRSDGGHGCPGG